MRQSQGSPYPYNNGCTISALSSHYPSPASGPCITLKLVWHHNMYLCGCGCVCMRDRPDKWLNVKCMIWGSERERHRDIGKWRSRDGWCPTDVISDEPVVEAALSVLISVMATACMYTVNDPSETPNVRYFLLYILAFSNQHLSLLFEMCSIFLCRIVQILPISKVNATVIKVIIMVTASCQITNCLTDNGAIILQIVYL